MLEMRLLAARRESSIGLERSATCGLFLVQRGNLNGQSKYLGRHALARSLVCSMQLARKDFNMSSILDS
jgi:hypothetical protein